MCLQCGVYSNECGPQFLVYPMLRFPEMLSDEIDSRMTDLVIERGDLSEIDVIQETEALVRLRIGDPHSIRNRRHTAGTSLRCLEINPKTNPIDIHPPCFQSQCLSTTTRFRRIPQVHRFALWLVLSGKWPTFKSLHLPHPRFSYHTGREFIHRFHESVDEAAHTWNQFTRICLWSSMCPCRVSCAEWTHICCRENYEDYMAQSPFHQAENCRTAAG